MKPILNKTTIAADISDRAHAPFPIFGFDRITIWLDLPELPIAKYLLESHCTGLEVQVIQMRHNARWKCRLAILQPTSQFLVLLAKALGHDASVLVTYAEIACDLPADSRRQAVLWCNEFLALTRMRYQRQAVVRYENSYYYGRRTDPKGRRANVLALYFDRPSKLNNAQPADDLPPCLHIEWRATGSAALEQLGIVSLEDLIRFDFQRFWNEHIHLYQLPNKTQLGRLLATACDADIDVSGTALRRRAERWKQKHSIHRNFIMHNALLGTTKLAPRLKHISFIAWVKAVR